MEFRIAATFQDSLLKLTGQDQKAVKLTVFDLQIDPKNPGLKFHRITKAKDPNFWSVRVNRDLRIIIHKTDSSFLLCYVDHHDDAYHWAERRKIAQHPKTGATQIVEVRERIEEIPIYTQVELPAPEQAKAAPLPKVFENQSTEDLLNYGVPEEWLDDVLTVADDKLLDLLEHLPAEAGEALLQVAAGEKPQIAFIDKTGVEEGFAHPDAQRRFHLIVDEKELAQALEYPWEKWTVFLHPAQQSLVERKFNGPAKAAGSAGTGKTVVAIHRVAHLAKQNPAAGLLLTTFSETLAAQLQIKLHRLLPVDSDNAERITVRSLNEVAMELYTAHFSAPRLAERSDIALAIQKASKCADHSFTERFLQSEWRNVVDAWQLLDWNAYRDVQRLGRKTRLGIPQREVVWKICEDVRRQLAVAGLITWPQLFGQLSDALSSESLTSPFNYAIVDEAQDMGISELRFLKALCPKDDGLFFAGDLGQRIFQQPFSWKSLGIDIRGRSHILRVNYRTSHQIRQQADRLLPESVRDVDGNEESRTGSVSVFSGPQPEVAILETSDKEIDAVANRLVQWQKEGIAAREIGIFVRSEAQFVRSRAALKSAGTDWCELERTTQQQSDKVSLSTMHLAKGLEFRAVIVMACDDEVIPLQERIETVADEDELEETYATERHLLYVACTRARENLFITGIDPASEFLDDFLEG